MPIIANKMGVIFTPQMTNADEALGAFALFADHDKLSADTILFTADQTEM